jgi:Tol biopolymer transport system component
MSAAYSCAMRGMLLFVLLFGLFLVDVGQAGTRNGSLTIVAAASRDGGGGGLYRVGERGLGKAIFRCGVRVPCWELEGVAWSPDGRSVAYGGESLGGDASYNGLWVLDVASGKSHRIRRANGAELGWYNVTWSPDGRRIAYVSYDRRRRARGSEILIVDADGSNRTRLETGALTSTAWPSWSPDGTRIAYAANVHISRVVGHEHGAVYVSRLDGTRRVQIATYGTAPSWSPDGRTIAYLTGCGTPPFKATELSGIRLATPTGRPVAPTRPEDCSTLGVAGAPAWSPDGGTIAMATRQGVFTMNANGTHLRLLTRTAPTSYATYTLSWMRPSWQPG